MTSQEIREWFTLERLEKLDLQKIEDLAGIDRESIDIILFYHATTFPEQEELLTPLLKMIEEGFNDCNK